MYIELADNVDRLYYFSIYSDMLKSKGDLAKIDRSKISLTERGIRDFAGKSSRSSDAVQLNTRFIATMAGRGAGWEYNKVLEQYAAHVMYSVPVQSLKVTDDVLKIFATEIGLLVTSTSNHRAYFPCLDIIDSLQKFPQLNDFTLTIEKKSYEEALRLQSNAKSGRTALDIR